MGDMTFSIAVLDDYQNVALGLADWNSLGPDVKVVTFHDHVADQVQLVNRLAPFDAVVAMRERTPLPARVLSGLPKLRLIVTTGGANAAIDMAAARDLGITVCGTAGRTGAVTTAELTWGLILSLARRIPQQDASIRAGGWQAGLGTMLRDKTLGVVGLGNIGRAVVPIGRAFGMRVTAWSRNLTAGWASEAGAEYVPRERFFAEADVVTVHLKLGPGSHGYVTRDDLRRMKPTALLVNTSRGPLINEDALAEALREGWIAGAALDVYGTEPLPTGDEFRRLPRTVLTPHIGYATEDTYQEYFPQIVEDIAAFLKGRPVREIGEENG
jgi:phosphoglycerate dehydrogenase-like enzyme